MTTAPRLFRTALLAAALGLGPAAARAAAPFAVESFEILEVAENTDPAARWVEYVWEARVRTGGAGIHRGHLAVTMLDHGGGVVREDHGPAEILAGAGVATLEGRFRVGSDEWLRADDFQVAAVADPSPVAVSGAVLRRLHVLPGTPMAQGNFAPMRWSVVVGNRGDGVAEASLELHLWGEAGDLLASYPVHHLKLAAGARIRLQAMTVLDGRQLQATRSITLDPVPLGGHGG